jgi:ELWxxDGT repeat protein
MVKDIVPGSGGSTPSGLIVAGNKIIFTANDGINGDEVWRSDGTTAGTVMVQNIVTPGGSRPGNYTLSGTNIFATVTTEEYGTELWVANTATVLPLTLLEFNGRLINGNGALTWKTTDEQNTASFDIERSTDGRTYTAIRNTAAFNSPGVHQYYYTDYNIVSLGSPVVYYRLKQKDMDGRATYSRIVALSVDNSRSIVLFYPNPVINEANLTITVNKPEKLQGRIIDNAGRVVKQQQWDLSAGSTSLPVDIKGLARGMYWLELKGETINDRKGFVKQ